jgi:hypothetical protein
MKRLVFDELNRNLTSNFQIKFVKSRMVFKMQLEPWHSVVRQRLRHRGLRQLVEFMHGFTQDHFMIHRKSSILKWRCVFVVIRSSYVV